MAQLLNTSRFIKTPLTKTRSGRETYGVVEGFDRLKNIAGDNFQFFTVDSCLSGRPDLIAHQFYGNSHLEWVIVIVNRPKNPLNWPAAGEVIKIPNNTFIRSLF